MRLRRGRWQTPWPWPCWNLWPLPAAAAAGGPSWNGVVELVPIVRWLLFGRQETFGGYVTQRVVENTLELVCCQRYTVASPHTCPYQPAAHGVSRLVSAMLCFAFLPACLALLKKLCWPLLLLGSSRNNPNIIDEGPFAFPLRRSRVNQLVQPHFAARESNKRQHEREREREREREKMLN